MAENIRLEVVTPEAEVVSDETQMIVAPGSEGEFGVLIGHTPFLTTLKIGTVRYEDSSGNERCVFVSGGFAETLPDKVTILAESAERRCDIDGDRAQAAMERAKNRVDGKDDNIDYTRSKAALERAMHRLKLVELKK